MKHQRESGFRIRSIHLCGVDYRPELIIEENPWEGGKYRVFYIKDDGAVNFKDVTAKELADIIFK